MLFAPPNLQPSYGPAVRNLKNAVGLL